MLAGAAEQRLAADGGVGLVRVVAAVVFAVAQPRVEHAPGVVTAVVGGGALDLEGGYVSRRFVVRYLKK